MSKIYYSLTNKFQFVDNEDGKGIVLDRSNRNNMSYIADCSSLSFHKAIIGISELRTIEETSNNQGLGMLRISKAITTYYIVYHTIISAMMLSADFQITLSSKRKKPVNGKIKLEVDAEKLNSADKTPEQWNCQQEYEQDLATSINHTEIKNFCKNMRKNGVKELNKVLEILYNRFIYHDYSNNSICIDSLYEKLCYVRDRSVYRPTCVIDKEGNFIQTSKYVRDEIDSLPTSNELYSYIQEIYLAIIEQAKQEKKDNYKNKQYYLFLFSLWNTPVEEEKEHLNDLGYSEEEIEKLRYPYYSEDKLGLNSHICQLIEVVDKNRLVEDIDELWNPLEHIYRNEFQKRDGFR